MVIFWFPFKFPLFRSIIADEYWETKTESPHCTLWLEWQPVSIVGYLFIFIEFDDCYLFHKIPSLFWLYAFEAPFCSLVDNWKRSPNTCHVSYIRTKHSFVGSTLLLLLLFLLLMLSISIGQAELWASNTWMDGLNVSTFRYINTKNKFLFSSPPAHLMLT